MISEKHSCVYIHIPKTGGTSIEKKLGHFEELSHNVQDHRTYSDYEAIANRYHQLRKVAFALKRGKFHRVGPNLRNAFWPEIGSGILKKYYKFTFVRNSWSRAYSWYNVIHRDPTHRSIFNIPENKKISFEEFIDTRLDPLKFSQM